VRGRKFQCGLRDFPRPCPTASPSFWRRVKVGGRNEGCVVRQAPWRNALPSGSAGLPSRHPQHNISQATYRGSGKFM